MAKYMSKTDILKDSISELRIIFKERDREVKEQMQETSRQMKETNLAIKKLSNLFTTQWGKLVEALTEGSLVELLRSQNIPVNRTRTRVIGICNDKRREFDIVAVNGNEVVAVEVKTTLKPTDVDYFLETMVDFRELCPEYKDWTVYGAVAYIKVDSRADIYAEKKGLFVIRAAGKNAVLMNAKNFTPRMLCKNP